MEGGWATPVVQDCANLLPSSGVLLGTLAKENHSRVLLTVDIFSQKKQAARVMGASPEEPVACHSALIASGLKVWRRHGRK